MVVVHIENLKIDGAETIYMKDFTQHIVWKIVVMHVQEGFIIKQLKNMRESRINEASNSD